jgi:hypothetical protein
LDEAPLISAFSLGNVFIIGKGDVPLISLPKDKGVRADRTERRERQLQNNMRNH